MSLFGFGPISSTLKNGEILELINSNKRHGRRSLNHADKKFYTP